MAKFADVSTINNGHNLRFTPRRCCAPTWTRESCPTSTLESFRPKLRLSSPFTAFKVKKAGIIDVPPTISPRSLV